MIVVRPHVFIGLLIGTGLGVGYLVTNVVHEVWWWFTQVVFAGGC